MLGKKLDVDFTDQQIIEEVTKDNSPEKDDTSQEAVPTKFTVSCDEAVLATNTLLQWANETGMDLEEISVLQQIQEKTLSDSFRAKRQKTIDFKSVNCFLKYNLYILFFY